MPPNFTLLDSSLADIASLVAAMLQARDAVERRSWSHPQEPTGEDWWADVLADPRARKREAGWKVASLPADGLSSICAETVERIGFTTLKMAMVISGSQSIF